MTHNTLHTTNKIRIWQSVLLLIIAVATCRPMLGQPNWGKRAAQSVCTLKTFASDGSLLASSHAFFISEDGEMLSPFTPFDGAARAVVIDNRGREMAVESIIGGNAMYDVAKFCVAKASAVPLALAADSAAIGAEAWILPHGSAKKPTLHHATIQRVERIDDGHAYYTLATPALGSVEGSPVLNAQGQVIGIMQRPYSDTATTNYAISAAMAAAMHTTGLSINDPTLRRTSIKKQLPRELDQALLTLYVAGGSLDSAAYVQLLDDFIALYPTAADGYVYKAQMAAGNGLFDEADNYMQQAVAQAERKDDAHYQYARLILQCLEQPGLALPEQWTAGKAAEEARAAHDASPEPIYKQMEAQALMAGQRYDEAYTLFMQLTDGPLRNAETFFSAAQCKERMGDTTATVALLDSAVATFSKPYLKAAAPYLLARAQALMQQGQHRKAVMDFNEYEKLMSTEVNANFYYIRAKAEIEGHMYQPAINDLTKASTMEPTNALLLAEKAALEMRLGLTQEAIATAQKCIEIDPQLSDGYLLLGFAQCVAGNKAEGAANLQKAHELGNPQAQALIDKYAK